MKTEQLEAIIAKQDELIVHLDAELEYNFGQRRGYLSVRSELSALKEQEKVNLVYSKKDKPESCPKLLPQFQWGDVCILCDAFYNNKPKNCIREFALKEQPSATDEIIKQMSGEPIEDIPTVTSTTYPIADKPLRDEIVAQQEELWDIYSETIGTDIDSLEYYSGKVILTGENYKKLCQELSVFKSALEADKPIKNEDMESNKFYKEGWKDSEVLWNINCLNHIEPGTCGRETSCLICDKYVPNIDKNRDKPEGKTAEEIIKSDYFKKVLELIKSVLPVIIYPNEPESLAVKICKTHASQFKEQPLREAQLSKEFIKGYRKGLKQGYKDGIMVDKSGL